MCYLYIIPKIVSEKYKSIEFGSIRNPKKVGSDGYRVGSDTGYRT